MTRRNIFRRREVSLLIKSMHQELDICVMYKGEQQCFPAVFNRLGYTYRFTVNIKDVAVIFEPDEERQWRARTESGQSLDKDVIALIPLVAEEIEKQLS